MEFIRFIKWMSYQTNVFRKELYKLYGLYELYKLII